MGYRDVNFPAYIRNHTDPIILDIGSYNGYDAVLFKQRFPNGRIYAIEASSHNMNKFQEAMSMGVNVRHLAIGETDGEITFYPSIGSGIDGSGSILKPSEKMQENHPLLVFSEERVACVTIPKFCEMEKIDRIDCIHIDAQGAELKILSKLGRFRPDCIFAEVCEGESYKGSFAMHELDEYMESIGYAVESRHGGTEEHPYNTLYVNKRI